MRKFKLLQDYISPFNTIRKGVIKTSEEWIEVFPNLEISDLEIKHDWFEETKEFLRWQPKIGDIYIYLNSEAQVEHATWEGTKLNNWHYKQGNCFEIQEELEKHFEILVIEGELRLLADWNRVNYVSYCIVLRDNKIVSMQSVNEEDREWIYRPRRLDFKFDSEMSCNRAIEQIGESKLKEYLQYRGN